MTQIIGHQFASGTSSSRPDGDAATGPEAGTWGVPGGEGSAGLLPDGLSRPDISCRMEKRPSRRSPAAHHNQEVPGSNPGPATSIDPAAPPGGGPKDGSAEVPPRSRPSSVFTLSPGQGPAALQTGPRISSDGRSPLRPAAGAVPLQGSDLITVHISTDTASLLALLAAERGESPGSAVARLVVAEIERKGGIARV